MAATASASPPLEAWNASDSDVKARTNKNTKIACDCFFIGVPFESECRRIIPCTRSAAIESLNTSWNARSRADYGHGRDAGTGHARGAVSNAGVCGGPEIG